MNKERKLALVWRWSVVLIICCILLWPVRGYVIIVGVAIAKIIVGAVLWLLIAGISTVFAVVVVFIVSQPKTWVKWLIRWLTAKDKIPPQQSKRLLVIHTDGWEYRMQVYKLKKNYGRPG